MPRCKNCKEKFEAQYFNQKYCLKDECVRVFVEVAKKTEWRKKKKEWKKELETVTDLLNEAQKLFNKWIRLRDKGLPCISCGQKPPFEENAGHFISSGKCKYLTMHEWNVNTQCVHCNQYKSGNYGEYRENLIKKIGEENVLWLEANRHKEHEYTRDELRQRIKELKTKIKSYANR